ncbi:hypothetical protein GE107_23850 [Cohnella sp. CFH 77786]|uniref:glycan biosynthesis hexose transferase WsfD n=1 Tax=Cohnella sp. CFH 77786 TaxID=2662265 RepID=UPI001C61016A|nr:hypothetical protein [Cohnella sp. CFH 77786]MBW5449070.1 hypothetical protein [Cohnella sp. CFH 77786]
MRFFRKYDIRLYFALIAALSGIGLAVWVLMTPPFIGVADNGDFSRLMRIAGFRYLDTQETYADRYFAYAHEHYGYKSNWGSAYVTTQILLLAVIGWIARIFNGQVFDIRWFGAVYTLLFATAVYLFIRYLPAIPGRKAATAAVSVLAGIMLLFVFGDVGYLAYFQSFFGEPYALLGMLLATASAFAMASQDKPGGRLLALFVIAAFAVVTSKIQNAPLGFAFALLAWRMLPLREDRRWHRQVLTGIAVLLASSVLMIVAAPSGLKQINLYQSIFYGVLKDSPDVARDMKELGIPDKYAVLAGTNYFQKGTAIPQNDPVLDREVLRKLGHKDIAAYYFRHPGRFVQKLEKAAENAVFVRPYYLGNYVKSEGKPRGALSHFFSVWSEWKVHRMPRSLGWFVGFYVLYFAGLIAYWLRSSSHRVRLGLESMAAVGLAGLFSAVVPILGDGEADLGKHLFMFNVCFDMMVVSAGAAAVYGIVRGLSRRGVSEGLAERSS